MFEDFQRCLEEFANHEYSKATELAAELSSRMVMSHPERRHLLAQVIVIGMLRVGVEDAFEQFGNMLLEPLAESPWLTDLIRLSAGKIPFDAVFAVAENDQQLAQAHYYHGARMLTEGNLEAARDHFEQCLAQGTDSWENDLARAELKNLAEPPPWIAIEQLQPNVEEYFRLHSRAKYPEALELAVQVYRAARSKMGDDHPFVARTTTDVERLIAVVSNVLVELGKSEKYEQALELGRRLCALTEESLGRKHEYYARGLKNLSQIYSDFGDHQSAEQHAREAVESYRRSGARDDATHGSLVLKLGSVLKDRGLFSEADTWLQEALELSGRALGKDHPDYGVTLNTLAELYREWGRLDAAERLYRESLNSMRRTGEDDTPRFADVLSNLALLHHMIADYAQAEKLNREALEIYQLHYPDGHRQILSSQANIAMLYLYMGRFDRAAALQEEVVQGYIALHGRRHEATVLQMNNLATVLAYQRRYDAACGLLEEVIEFEREVLGEVHPRLAGSLCNLGEIHVRKGDFDTAQRLFEQSLTTMEGALGKEHLNVCNPLRGLTAIHAAKGNADLAVRLMDRISRIEDHSIRQVFAIGSSRQQIEFLGLMRRHWDLLLSVTVRYLRGMPEAIRITYDCLLRRKGIVAESLARRTALISRSDETSAHELQVLDSLRARINRVFFGSTLRGGGAMCTKELEDLNTQKERLEVELARRAPNTDVSAHFFDVNCQKVADAIPAGAVLVEFVRGDLHQFESNLDATTTTESEEEQDSLSSTGHYCVFILHSGRADDIRLIDLGEAWEIDDKLAVFRAVITGEREPRLPQEIWDGWQQSLDEVADSQKQLEQTIKSMFGSSVSDESGGGQDSRIGCSPSTYQLDYIGLLLWDKVFMPFWHELGKSRRLLIAPDGDLSRLPFELLPYREFALQHRPSGYLLEEYEISYVTTGREVVRFDVRSEKMYGDPLVIANPDFDLQNTAKSDGRTRQWGGESINMVNSAKRQSQLDCFARLPGTQVEGKRVARRLRVEPLLEENALTSRLKEVHSPVILHLATHGFFLEDHPQPSHDDLRGLGSLGMPISDKLSRPNGPLLENPLLRSGLALSGVNTWLAHGNSASEAEDGLLTADDVAGLDLLDTELVVLSACETGLGQIHVGEGVMGLRRSFALAGAKTLVLSLWKVPDLATAILMDHFYDNLLSRRLARDQSLRAAQLHVRAITVGQLREPWLTSEMIEELSGGDATARRKLQELSQQADEHRPFAHPLFWGAFICQGDPGPLIIPGNLDGDTSAGKRKPSSNRLQEAKRRRNKRDQ